MDQIQIEATEILCDNRSVISLTKNPTMHLRTKHMNIHFHFIRGLVTDGKILLKYCKTKDQLADILTNRLPINKFKYFRSMLGVYSF